MRRNGLAVAAAQRPLDHLEERRLVVLRVEARGQPNRIAGVEANVLRHALGERLAGHVPGQLEERDALLGRDAGAPPNVLIEYRPELRVGQVGLGRRVEEPARRQRLHDLHEAAVDLAASGDGRRAGPAPPGTHTPLGSCCAMASDP